MLRRHHRKAVGYSLTKRHHHFLRSRGLCPLRTGLPTQPLSCPHRLVRRDRPLIRLPHRKVRVGYGRRLNSERFTKHRSRRTSPHVSVGYRRAFCLWTYSPHLGYRSRRTLYSGYVKSPKDRHVARVQLRCKPGAHGRSGPDGEGI